jgi:diadenosine tetraphosphate (Ap4A) HIT family hydrolase
LEGARWLLKVARPAWQAKGKKMVNDTMRKFGYPESLVREYAHWVVLLRPAQVTLGSLILAAKSDATAFGQLPPEAYAELATVTKEVEATLLAEIGYEKINYLMLMMVDPYVHFHIFPRYEGLRSFGAVSMVDRGWPGPPDLKSGRELTTEAFREIQDRLIQHWLTTY